MELNGSLNSLEVEKDWQRGLEPESMGSVPVLKEWEDRDSSSYSLSTCRVAHRWRGSIRGQDWSLPLLETDGLEGPRTEQRKKPCAVKGLTVECESGRREP